MSAHHSPQEANGPFASNFQLNGASSGTKFKPGGMEHYGNMASMTSFDPSQMDFTMMQGLEDDLEMDQSLFDGQDRDFQMNWGMFQNQGMSNVDPSQVWQSPDLAPRSFGMGLPGGSQPGARSAQGSIVSKRDQVVEQFGQITPPDENTPDPSAGSSSKGYSDAKRKIQEEDIAKENRTQRARNAANKRHSKPKASRRDSAQNAESDIGDGDDDQRQSTTVQREKNRLAAAKCRAKKKATSEEMQQSHREGSKENSYLQREVRELRDQKAFLRNSLLQHEPGVCKCHAIHRFNLAQAHQLAMGVGAMLPQQLSPTPESISSAITPGSDCSLGGHVGALAQGGIPRGSIASSRAQSFNNGSNFNIGQINGPETYPPPEMSPDQSIPGQFADFLNSSPDEGRRGFS